jgi:hypothetical protein
MLFQKPMNAFQPQRTAFTSWFQGQRALFQIQSKIGRTLNRF